MSLPQHAVYPPARRPRSSSDTYTALPARVARQNGPRSRRASDATPLPRYSTLLQNGRPPRSSLESPDQPRAPSYHPIESGRSPNQPRALDMLNGRRDSQLTAPTRTYQSPTSRYRPTSDDSYQSDSELHQNTSSRLDSKDHTSLAVPGYYFPTYDRFLPAQPPPQETKSKPFSSHLRNFFSDITREPPLPSLPPTLRSRRRGQFAGNTEENEDKRAMHEFDQPEDDYERDMLVRAIRLNGDLDGQNSLATDADVQLYPEPPRPPEQPFFLQQLQDEGDGENSKDKEKHLSYRERRKKGKHKIVYNRDSEENQQRLIIILARALIAFGSPSHRIEPQLASVATLFEMPAQFVHTPGCVQICFGHPESRMTETLIVKADSNLDLGRIDETHSIYRAVVRDEITATEGYWRLEKLIKLPPLYSKKTQFFLTFLQGFVLCGSSFGGSIIDMCAAGVLSLLVALAQLRASRSQLSSSGADIFIAGIVSLAARALSVRVPGQIFCYQSISSTGVAGLLPGAVMLAGVLDIASKNIHLGSPKLVTGLMTSLYLGFGLTVGSDIWLHFDKTGRDSVSTFADKVERFNGTFQSTNSSVPDWLSPANLTGIWTFQETFVEETHHVISGCYRDPSWGWWLKPLPWYSLFATLPVLNLVLSMKRCQPLWTIEMPVMIIISCASTAVTHVANYQMALAGHPDYTALLGSFVVSLLGNIYSRKFGGTAFTIMLTGIWLLIPTGLAQAGGLSSSYSPGEDEYTESLELARKMISVIIGVMSGVYLSARIVYAFGKKKNSAFVTF